MKTKQTEVTNDNRLLAAARYLHHHTQAEKERSTLRVFRQTAEQSKTPTGRIKKHWQVEIDRQEKALRQAIAKADACKKVFAEINWEIRKADKAQSIALRDKVLDRVTDAVTGGEILSMGFCRFDISNEYDAFLKEHIRLMSIHKPDYAKDRDFYNYGDLGENGQRVVYDLTGIVEARHGQSLPEGADCSLYEEETIWTEGGGRIRQKGSPIRFHLSLHFSAIGDLVRAELHHGSVDSKPVDRKRYNSDTPSWSHSPMTDSFGNSFLDGLNFAATGTKCEDEMRAEAYAMLMACDLAKVLTPLKQDRSIDWDTNQHDKAEALYHANRLDADTLLATHGTDVTEYLPEPEEETV